MREFRNGIRERTPRISNEEWERWKPVIVEKYQSSTIDEVREYMESEHKFVATNRQFGHRLRDVWKIRKYGKDLSVPPPDTTMAPFQPAISVQESPRVAAGLLVVRLVPILDFAELNGDDVWPQKIQLALSRDTYSLLADVLAYLGDSHTASRIVMALWDVDIENKSTSPKTYTGTWLSSAQSALNLRVARVKARESNKLLNPAQRSWERWLVDFFYAHTYGREAQEEESDGQIQLERIFNEIIYQDNQGRDILHNLTRRMPGPGFDILVYVLLRSSLVWYNSGHLPEEKFEIDCILNQFVDRQLPVASITCIPMCVQWCIEKLEIDQNVPPEINTLGTEFAPSRATNIVTIFCTLWYHLQRDCWRGPEPEWVHDAEPQLGILHPQLLGIIVNMMVAVEICQSETRNRAVVPEMVLESALAGARALRSLGNDGTALRDHFLRQACVCSWRLMEGVPAEERGFELYDVTVDAAATAPYREYLARSLGIGGLPPLPL
ncbi:hypothetical protein P885DRAFT_36807 [Corynascus similis CBS 632.67]